MNAGTDDIKAAQELYDTLGNGWLSELIWSDNYAIQCGENLLALDLGVGDEPPVAYATGDTECNAPELSAETATCIKGDCMDIFLDFTVGGRTRLKIMRDRFVDQDGYEYALVEDGHRVADLPATLLKYDSKSSNNKH